VEKNISLFRGKISETDDAVMHFVEHVEPFWIYLTFIALPLFFTTCVKYPIYAITSFRISSV
jgi:hypothetical protein